MIHDNEKSIPMTDEEALAVRDSMNLEGNVVFAKKYGDSRIIILDTKIETTKAGRRAVLDNMARVLERQTPGYTCHIPDPKFDF